MLINHDGLMENSEDSFSESYDDGIALKLKAVLCEGSDDGIIEEENILFEHDCLNQQIPY